MGIETSWPTVGEIFPFNLLNSSSNTNNSPGLTQCIFSFFINATIVEPGMQAVFLIFDEIILTYYDIDKSIYISDINKKYKTIPKD